MVPRSADQPDSSFEALFERANGLLYQQASKAQSAFEQLLAQTASDDHARRARLHERLCIATRIQGNYVEARRHGDSTMSLYETCEDDAGMGRACVALGNISWSEGDLLTALAHYETALELRQKHGDQRAIAGALGSIANILSELNRIPEARSRYELALNIYSRMGDERFTARTYNNLGECFLLLDETETALKHCHIALALGRRIDDRTDEPNVLINLGRIHARRREWQVALDRLDEAAATAVIGEDRRAEAEAMMYRAQLTEDRGREDRRYLKQAELYRQEALALAEAIGALPLCQQLHEHCAVAADRVGNKDKSARHWAIAREIKAAGSSVSS